MGLWRNPSCAGLALLPGANHPPMKHVAKNYQVRFRITDRNHSKKAAPAPNWPLLADRLPLTALPLTASPLTTSANR
jgi:hypothetical protein